MATEKTLKKDLEKKTRKNPDSYYPTKILKSKGFKRGECSNCGIMYWSIKDRRVCGEPACIGGYKFIGQPLGKKHDFIQAWKSFSSFMKARGYTPIKRYPIVARWRADEFWTAASIYNFQPYVLNGMVEPPANPLVVPQTCVRFNDIDNIGLSGRHCSCFVMVGQHAFTSPNDYQQDKYFQDLLEWLISLGIPIEELIVHEDQWSGGGNMGVSLEIFAGGLELCNQVYMSYEVTPGGLKELNLKVLDMGLGQERIPWITNGSNTMYDAIYPTVIKNLMKLTGVKIPDFYQKFLPHSGLLNADEVDMEEAWKIISDKIGVDTERLKKTVMPLAALYSIADHARTLLITIADGAIPSNTGGGYDIRSLFRRAYNFIKEYDWPINLSDVCKWHAEYLKPQYPELIKAISQVKKILKHEEQKFLKTRGKWKDIINKVLKGGVTTKELIKAYESHGVSPQLIKKKAEEKGIKVKVPDDFYSQVSKSHTLEEKKAEKKLVKTSDLPGVKKLCYEKDLDFKARVLRLKDKLAILNKTAFYPTSGGQEHDTGTIGGVKVVDVISQDNQIIHVLAHKPGFKQGDEVKGLVDAQRRRDLMKHHTATHIINGAARKVLGEHVWQAGSKVSPDKAHLDITHYKLLSKEEIDKIEKEANKVVTKGIHVHKKEVPRSKAELEYGFRLYQGGEVPSKMIRVVDVRGHDIEACGGTHIDNTTDIELIKVFKTSKVQDGVIRLEYFAGDQAKKFVEKNQKMITRVEALTGLKAEHGVEEMANVFSVQPKHLVKTVKRFINEAKGFGAPQKELIKGKNAKQGLEHLFNTWKKYRKLSKKKRK